MTENAAPPEARPGFWRNFFNRTFSPEQQALTGTLAFFAIIALLIYAGVDDAAPGGRMETFTSQYNARSVQRGAALFAANCTVCHGPDGLGLTGIAPALNTPELFSGARLEQLSFAGTVEDYVSLTISAGRPARSGPWPNPMPTWSQDYGGPLRPDQVRDLTNFVMSWGCSYDEDCIPEVERTLVVISTIGPTPTTGPTATLDPTQPQPICRSAEDCDAFDTLPEGDAANGEALFTNVVPGLNGQPLGCTSCHTLDGTIVIGPSLQGVSERVPPEYGSIEEYLYASILHPNEFVREGFAPGLMLQDFGLRISGEMLADLIAFLRDK
jgi:mono/diheme cytochrome c family protein